MLPDKILIDISEELIELKTILTNQIDIQNALMDLFENISSDPLSPKVSINSELLLGNFPVEKLFNLLEVLNKIKASIILKLTNYNLNLGNDYKYFNYYFKSLHGNRVILKYLSD